MYHYKHFCDLDISTAPKKEVAGNSLGPIH